MDARVEKPPVAWQPLTPRGVAAFAHASLGRVFLAQFIVALLVAVTVLWFLREGWLPAIREAIRHLPAQGEIRAGVLDWRGDSPQRLAENRFVALAVDLNHEGVARSPAHIQIEFGRRYVRIISLLGFVELAYPKEWVIAFNQADLEPAWGAWAPPILVIIAGMVVSVLMLSWVCLATIYLVPIWLVGFFGNRDLSWRGSWRLAGAALMPGALFLCAAIFFYGLGILDLVRLMIAGILHLMMGWIYSFVSPLALPRHPETAATERNPFAPAAQGLGESASKRLPLENKR